MTIHVLGTFTGECRTSGGSTDDETTGQLVGGSPEAVTCALETEHRVEHVDRNHDLAVSRIRRTSSSQRRGRTGFVNAHMPELALCRFLIGQEQITVHRHVVLSTRVVDLCRWGERGHCKGTGD